jgi:hypothetical protein
MTAIDAARLDARAIQVVVVGTLTTSKYRACSRLVTAHLAVTDRGSSTGTSHLGSRARCFVGKVELVTGVARRSGCLPARA